ncbi:MAG: universal stress protein [Oligoflexales bacterium]
MKNYMNILVAVELIREIDENILGKTLDLSKNSDSKLHLVHVIEPVLNYGRIPSMAMECPQKYESYVRRKISELGSKFAVPEKNQFVVVGRIENQIFGLIKIIDADLLVVGNHSRHGFRALFKNNHTSSLVKNTGCDMLAIRVA